LIFPAEIDSGVTSSPVGLLGSDVAEIGERLVVVDPANVIAPAIGQIVLALGEEQQVMRGTGWDRFE
jgi:hypothetical protein